MEVLNSKFLSNSKPIIKKLVSLLKEDYAYVSVLGTDTKSKNYSVNAKGVSVSNGMLTERGFVVRIYNGINYSEYSFNHINENNLTTVIEEIKSGIGSVPKDIPINSYPLIQEEELCKSFLGEVEIDPEILSSQGIIKALSNIVKEGMDCSKLVINFTAMFESSHISKIFISDKKDLEQSYTISQCNISSVVNKGGNIKYYYDCFSGLKGFEVLADANDNISNVVKESIKLLDSKEVIPGEYDVICSPEISGLIAHEAFGHGVEMDMFVKKRAKGAEYINKEVASCLTTMHDGATAASHVSSYLFDDEGTIGKDTLVIENGILINGISDLLSATKLGTTPTGNGKRESFERKAYSRMTNTFFEGGKDKFCDMIASIDKGYLIDKMYSGMEDPKNWGLQCIALVGREIINGRLTGNVISPVILTGFVPEVLKSISMVSQDVELSGSGFCGKGYKEFVKTSNGGPYIKAKVRLS